MTPRKTELLRYDAGEQHTNTRRACALCGRALPLAQLACASCTRVCALCPQQAAAARPQAHTSGLGFEQPVVLSGVAGHQLKVLVALVPYLVITVGIYPLWGVVCGGSRHTGAGGLSLSLSTGLCDSAPSLCRVPRSGLRLSTVCAGSVETPNTTREKARRRAPGSGGAHKTSTPCAKRGTLRLY